MIPSSSLHFIYLVLTLFCLFRCTRPASWSQSLLKDANKAVSVVAGSWTSSTEVLLVGTQVSSTLFSNVMRSSDGGSTWAEMLKVQTGNPQFIDISSQTIGSVTYSVVVATNGAIYYSRNKFTTSATATVVGTTPALYSVTIAPTGVGFAVGAVSNHPVVYTALASANFSTWTALTSSVFTASSKKLRGVATFDGQNILTVGTGVTVFQSSNNGSTWSTVDLSSLCTDSSTDLYSVGYKNKNFAMIGGTNGCVVKYDKSNGVSYAWNKVSSSYITGSSAFFYHSINIATSNIVFLIEEVQGQILRSVDSGVTWYREQQSSSVKLYCIAAYDYNIAIVGADNSVNNGFVYVRAVDPSSQPSSQPTNRPSQQPSSQPTLQPVSRPSGLPSMQPSSQPTRQPFSHPSARPSRQPTSHPSSQPSTVPLCHPSAQPSGKPSGQPSRLPSAQPSQQPFMHPSSRPTVQPSSRPTSQPAGRPSAQPSRLPSSHPTVQPTGVPSKQPSSMPTTQPSSRPSRHPTNQPTARPSSQPSSQPSKVPTAQPSSRPSVQPSSQPSAVPSHQPSSRPSSLPTLQPSAHPTHQPTSQPSSKPTNQPFAHPSMQPTGVPSTQPTNVPSSSKPSSQPTGYLLQGNWSSVAGIFADSAYRFLDVRCSDTINCVMVGYYYSEAKSKNFGIIAHTAHGGVSKYVWSLVLTLPGYKVVAVTYFERRNIWYACDNFGGVYGSTDSGVTWYSYWNLTNAEVNVTSTAVHNNVTSSVNVLNGIAVNFNGDFYAAGPSIFWYAEIGDVTGPGIDVNWKYSKDYPGVNDVSETDAGFVAVAMNDGLMGTCYYNREQGVQCSLHRLTNADFYSIGATKSNFVAIATDGTVAKFDLYHGWSRLPINISEWTDSHDYGHNVVCLTNAVYYIADAQGRIYETKNGGTVWVNETFIAVSPLPIYSLYFWSTSVAIAGNGQGGTYVKRPIPTSAPSSHPSNVPSSQPSKQPFRHPTSQPSRRPTSQPSRQPSRRPTTQPSRQPFSRPTGQPSRRPTSQPSRCPTNQPSGQPTLQPLGVPTSQPSVQPSGCPSTQPSGNPSGQPSMIPSMQPSGVPSQQPSCQPTGCPSSQPTMRPSSQPSGVPSSQPTSRPSGQPSRVPTCQPSMRPSRQPTAQPSMQPFGRPSGQPSRQPTAQPSRQPSGKPSVQPSRVPTSQPSRRPTRQPTGQPSRQPTSQPTRQPTRRPTSQPSRRPTTQPSARPSRQPSGQPSRQPTGKPSGQPSRQPSVQPTSMPSDQPTGLPSSQPSMIPSDQPTRQPTVEPTGQPSVQPTCLPSSQPSGQPSGSPTQQPSGCPTTQPTSIPSKQPSGVPTQQPTRKPTGQPTGVPTMQPFGCPSSQPTSQPTGCPTSQPSGQPSCWPSSHPSGQPTRQPSGHPSAQPSRRPTNQPSAMPSRQPSGQPSRQPVSRPTGQPSRCPTSQPSRSPSRQPTGQPSRQPTTQPTGRPSRQPSARPTRQPFGRPTGQPTRQPTAQPSMQPSGKPSQQPTMVPTMQPSSQPSAQPTGLPTGQPSEQPSSFPTCQPSMQPSRRPSMQPSSRPTLQPVSTPTGQPSMQPTAHPSGQPFCYPTAQPSVQPSVMPSIQPSGCPSLQPSAQPSAQPTCEPSSQPSGFPTGQPSGMPSGLPSGQPSSLPSQQPSVQPSMLPSSQPSGLPSGLPTMQPSGIPSSQPLGRPSSQPSRQPSARPSRQPSRQPTGQPSRRPTSQPSRQPSRRPTSQPTRQPSRQPTSQPSRQPTSQPSSRPTSQPSGQPSRRPTTQPTGQPSRSPTTQPSARPSCQPTSQPTHIPTTQPSAHPSRQPSMQPSRQPTSRPSMQPTRQPTMQPSSQPTRVPSSQPSKQPINRPTGQPSRVPSMQPSGQPSRMPSRQPTRVPTTQPTRQPLCHPTSQPSRQPLNKPTGQPSRHPSSQPSRQPSRRPTVQPTGRPSCIPTQQPVNAPTGIPSGQPSMWPTGMPSGQPSHLPSSQPSSMPSDLPTGMPSAIPTRVPTTRPTSIPTQRPLCHPTSQPSRNPSRQPTRQPTRQPSSRPSRKPSGQPSRQPTSHPSHVPSSQPSAHPSSQPTNCPSGQPTDQPSQVPSTQPSSAPSLQPSGSPSTQPTREPSGQPSSIPTTSFPTNQPSGQPSRLPSSQPSVSPTKALLYAYTFNVTQAIQGTTKARYTRDKTRAVKAITTTIVDLVPSLIYPDVRVIRVTDVLIGSRRLAEFEEQDFSSLSGTNGILVVYGLSYIPYSKDNNDRMVEYQLTKSTLTEAVTSGLFNSTLHNNAVLFNATSLLKATAVEQYFNVSPIIDPFFLHSPKPTSQPSSSPSLQPFSPPTSLPSSQPAGVPSSQPSSVPSVIPTSFPTFTLATKYTLLLEKLIEKYTPPQIYLKNVYYEAIARDAQVFDTCAMWTAYLDNNLEFSSFESSKLIKAVQLLQQAALNSSSPVLKRCETPRAAADIVNAMANRNLHPSEYVEKKTVACDGDTWVVNVCGTQSVAVCVNCNDPCQDLYCSVPANISTIEPDQNANFNTGYITLSPCVDSNYDYALCPVQDGLARIFSVEMESQSGGVLPIFFAYFTAGLLLVFTAMYYEQRVYSTSKKKVQDMRVFNTPSTRNVELDNLADVYPSMRHSESRGSGDFHGQNPSLEEPVHFKYAKTTMLTQLASIFRFTYFDPKINQNTIDDGPQEMTATNRQLREKLWLGVFPFHYFAMGYHSVLSGSRSLRIKYHILAVHRMILVVFFMSVFFNAQFVADDGTCNRQTTQSACEAFRTTFSTSVQTCLWHEGDFFVTSNTDSQLFVPHCVWQNYQPTSDIYFRLVLVSLLIVSITRACFHNKAIEQLLFHNSKTLYFSNLLLSILQLGINRHRWLYMRAQFRKALRFGRKCIYRMYHCFDRKKQAEVEMSPQPPSDEIVVGTSSRRNSFNRDGSVRPVTPATPTGRAAASRVAVDHNTVSESVAIQISSDSSVLLNDFKQALFSFRATFKSGDDQCQTFDQRWGLHPEQGTLFSLSAGDKGCTEKVIRRVYGEHCDPEILLAEEMMTVQREGNQVDQELVHWTANRQAYLEQKRKRKNTVVEPYEESIGKGLFLLFILDLIGRDTYVGMSFQRILYDTIFFQSQPQTTTRLTKAYLAGILVIDALFVFYSVQYTREKPFALEYVWFILAVLCISIDAIVIEGLELFWCKIIVPFVINNEVLAAIQILVALINNYNGSEFDKPLAQPSVSRKASAAAPAMSSLPESEVPKGDEENKTDDGAPTAPQPGTENPLVVATEEPQPSSDAVALPVVIGDAPSVPLGRSNSTRQSRKRSRAPSAFATLSQFTVSHYFAVACAVTPKYRSFPQSSVIEAYRESLPPAYLANMCHYNHEAVQEAQRHVDLEDSTAYIIASWLYRTCRTGIRSACYYFVLWTSSKVPTELQRMAVSCWTIFLVFVIYKLAKQVILDLTSGLVAILLIAAFFALLTSMLVNLMCPINFSALRSGVRVAQDWSANIFRPSDDKEVDLDVGEGAEDAFSSHSIRNEKELQAQHHEQVMEDALNDVLGVNVPPGGFSIKELQQMRHKTHKPEEYQLSESEYDSNDSDDDDDLSSHGNQNELGDLNTDNHLLLLLASEREEAKMGESRGEIDTSSSDDSDNDPEDEIR